MIRTEHRRSTHRILSAAIVIAVLGIASGQAFANSAAERAAERRA